MRHGMLRQNCFYLARINMNIVFLNSMVGVKYTLLFGLLIAF